MAVSKKDIMNLESMLLLLAVTQHEGKRKASDAISTSVDTINKYIDNLEQTLKTKLVNCNGRGTTLTPNGRKITESALKIKNILNEIYVAASEEGEVKGKVRIGMAAGLNANLFAESICNLYDQYPEISINMHSDFDALNISDLSFDIGIGYEKPSGSEAVVLYNRTLKFYFFASPEYLAVHGYPLDFEDMLENHRIINKESYYRFAKGINKDLEGARFLCYTTNSSFAMAEVIRNNLGIGLLPAQYKNEGLVCLDNIKYSLDIPIYLFAHRNIKDIPRVRAVINHFKTVLSKI